VIVLPAGGRAWMLYPEDLPHWVRAADQKECA
jgi:hypothetical protein